MLSLSLSHPPEHHVWANLESQLSRLITTHPLAFVKLLNSMNVPEIQFLEPLFQLIKRHNMHYCVEWLDFSSRINDSAIMNEELLRMLKDKRHLIMTDYSNVYKITSSSFSLDVIRAFSNSGPIDMQDLETFSGLVKLSVRQFDCGIPAFYQFLKQLPSSNSRLPRNELIKFIIQLLFILADKSMEYEEIMSVVSELVGICEEECFDLKFLFDKTDSDSLKSAAVEFVGKISGTDNPSADEVILCVILILSLQVGGFPENLTNSIALKSRKISKEMSDWEWLALAGIVVKTSPPSPVNVDFNVFDTSKQDRCELYLGAVDLIYARLQKLPPVNLDAISAFSCLPLEQYRNLQIQALPFPHFFPVIIEETSPSLLSFHTVLLHSTFYWEIVNNEETILSMDRISKAALEESSVLIAIPEDNGKYSVTLRNFEEDEIVSKKLENRMISIQDMYLIHDIGIIQFYLQDKALYRLKPHLLTVSPEVYEIHNNIWRDICRRSDLLLMLFSKESS